MKTHDKPYKGSVSFLVFLVFYFSSLQLTVPKKWIALACGYNPDSPDYCVFGKTAPALSVPLEYAKLGIRNEAIALSLTVIYMFLLTYVLTLLGYFLFDKFWANKNSLY